jgi:FRG domain
LKIRVLRYVSRHLRLRSEACKPSKLQPIADVATWDDFKRIVSQWRPYQVGYRGQENNAWRLRTAFHRTGRANLPRFMSQDIGALHKHLSILTSHRFNLNDPLDYASFLNLAQHHGYPTPLLDWSMSPFIAAYFAFKNLRRERITSDHRVRILIFDGTLWSNDSRRATVVSPGFLHITLIEPLPINNPRAIPQQSVSSVTNIDDLETSIRLREDQTKKTYLRAIDLPASERKTAMQELALMGVGGGTLFPGLDGACEQLRERFFDL